MEQRRAPGIASCCAGCGCLLPAAPREPGGRPNGTKMTCLRTSGQASRLCPRKAAASAVVDGLDDIRLPRWRRRHGRRGVKADEHVEGPISSGSASPDEGRRPGLPYAGTDRGRRRRASAARRAEVEGKELPLLGTGTTKGRRSACRMKDRSGRKRTASVASTPLSSTMRPGRRSPFLDEEEDIAVLPGAVGRTARRRNGKRLDEANQPEKDRFSGGSTDLADDGVAEDKTPFLRTNLMRMHRAGAIGLRKNRRRSSCSRPPPACPAAMTPASGRRTTASASGSAR